MTVYRREAISAPDSHGATRTETSLSPRLVRLAARRAAGSISEDAREALLPDGRRPISRCPSSRCTTARSSAPRRRSPVQGSPRARCAHRHLLGRVEDAPSVGRPVQRLGQRGASCGTCLRLRRGFFPGATWSTSGPPHGSANDADTTTAVDRVEFGFVARSSEPLDRDRPGPHRGDGRPRPAQDRAFRAAELRPRRDQGCRVAEGTTPRVVHAPRVTGGAGRLLDQPGHGLGRRRGLRTASDMSGRAACRVSSPSRVSGTVRSPTACCSRPRCSTRSSLPIPRSTPSAAGSLVWSGRTDGRQATGSTR